MARDRAGIGRVAACDEASGDRPAARHGYRRLLELGEKAGEVGLVITALEGLARNSLVEDPVLTAELLGRAESLRRRYDRPAAAAERSAVGSDHQGRLGRPGATWLP